MIPCFDMRAQMIDHAFTWLQANLVSFDPFKDDGTFDPKRGKAFAELALLNMYFLRCVRVEEIPCLGLVLDYVERTAHQPSFRALLVRQPALSILNIIPYVALEACGRPYPDQRILIQRVIDTGYVTTFERVPYRMLDLLYLLDCGGYRHSLPDYDSLYRQTMTYHLPPILYLAKCDVYSITHTLFYLTDFGLRDPAPLLGERLEATRDVVTLLLGVYTRARDWDLVSELLICCSCLNWRPAPLFDLGWQGVLEAQSPAGYVPGPTFDPDSPKLNQPEKASTYLFQENYHTTLVTLLACLVENHREETP